MPCDAPAHVSLDALHRTSLEKTCRDQRHPASVEEARTRVEAGLGQVDILVNNAATFESVTWDALDFELWQRVMSVNLNGTMLMCKAFLPLMRGRGWGRVINIASASVAIASPASIAYRASGGSGGAARRTEEPTPAASRSRVVAER